MDENGQVLLLLGRIDERTERQEKDTQEIKEGVATIGQRVTVLEVKIDEPKGVTIPAWLVRPGMKVAIAIILAAALGGGITKWLAAGQAVVSSIP